MEIRKKKARSFSFVFRRLGRQATNATSEAGCCRSLVHFGPLLSVHHPSPRPNQTQHPLWLACGPADGRGELEDALSRGGGVRILKIHARTRKVTDLDALIDEWLRV